MKIFKSIKWRLQIWYGLILVVVLAGFGFTAYQLEFGRQMRRVNDELQLRFDALAKVLHPPLPRPDAENPPPGQFPGDVPPEENSHLDRVKFNQQVADLFSMNDSHDFRFAVFDRHGHEIAAAGNVPSQFYFGSDDPFRGNPDIGPKNMKLPPMWTADWIRGVFIKLPSGESIIVVCNITPELKELHRTAWQLTLVGGIILFVGLAGGGWLVSRAIRPVAEISSAAVKISDGDLSQRISIAETESELGQLAAVLNSTFARLETAFVQQQQFTSDAAHELRTPVSVMLTQTQTALNRERSAPEYRETVEACQRAAQRMRKLITALLELARLDAGQEILKRVRFDFSETISDCVESVRPLAEECGVKIFTDLPPLEISGDSERLSQVATNLLTNAIQCNKSGGEVRTKLESQNGLAALTVSDTGAGISAEDLPRMFERFYRADKSRSSGNAGLGLAISKAIVEAHGGTIEVSSAKNAGTIFTIRLPI